MPTQTKRRQKQGQDETRHPPQKSIMQNTDVKQTKKKSIFITIKSEFLQMFTQLPFFLSNPIFCFYLDLHKFQKCLKIRATLLKFAPVNIKF